MPIIIIIHFICTKRKKTNNEFYNIYDRLYAVYIQIHNTRATDPIRSIRITKLLQEPPLINTRQFYCSLFRCSVHSKKFTQMNSRTELINYTTLYSGSLVAWLKKIERKKQQKTKLNKCIDRSFARQPILKINFQTGFCSDGVVFSSLSTSHYLNNFFRSFFISHSKFVWISYELITTEHSTCSLSSEGKYYSPDAVRN